MWMNNEPNRARRNRPREKGPSATPRTDPINTGVTEAVNENGREASIQIGIRLGPAPAVRGVKGGRTIVECGMRKGAKHIEECMANGKVRPMRNQGAKTIAECGVRN